MNGCQPRPIDSRNVKTGRWMRESGGGEGYSYNEVQRDPTENVETWTHERIGYWNNHGIWESDGK